MEFLAIILLASFVLSGHPSLDILPVIGGGLLGFYLLPRLFLFLAKKGLLGNNWNKEGLRNNPFK